MYNFGNLPSEHIFEEKRKANWICEILFKVFFFF